MAELSKGRDRVSLISISSVSYTRTGTQKVPIKLRKNFFYAALGKSFGLSALRFPNVK